MTPNKLKPYSEWSDEELKKALSEIAEVMGDRTQKRRKEKKRTLNINGITVKDFVVIYAPLHEEDEPPAFSFYLVRDGKLYDLEEDSGTFDAKHIFHFHSWWPTVNNEDESGGYGFKADMEMYNAAYSFIPGGFQEDCENCYAYGRDTKKALQTLKDHGFEVVIEAKFEDQGYYDDVYKEWLKQNENKNKS